MIRVVGYCRVSTNEQADFGVSLDAQRDKVEQYAKLYDLELVEIITDAGESAKSLNRPGIQRALAMLRDGQADGLVIAKLDRLTRSVRDWQELIDDYFCERAGKQLFSVADSIDTRTASGRMVLGILMVVAQAERELIGERTKAALQHKIRNGERAGRLRFGYDLAGDGKTLIPNVREQQALCLMRELREDEWPLRAIAEELTRQGFKTKDGKPWSHNSVSFVLKRFKDQGNAA